MINDLPQQCDFEKLASDFARLLDALPKGEHQTVASLLTIDENFPATGDALRAAFALLVAAAPRVSVLGVTGSAAP